MKKAILFLMFVLMLNVVNAVDTGNLTETDANFTIYMDNTGLMEFNYPGNKNVTWNATLGWAKINNGSVITTYNISPGEAWALYQDPTTCVMPYEETTLGANAVWVQCKGQFYTYDTDSDGTIKVNGNNVTIDCNGATNIGYNNNSVRFISSGSQKNGTIIKGCRVQNYTSFIYNWQGNYWSVYNNTATEMQDNDAVTLAASHYSNIWNNTFKKNENQKAYIAIRAYNGGTDNVIFDNFIEGYRYAIALNSENFSISRGNYVINQGFWSIYASNNAYNNTISDNKIFNSNWNGIMFGSGGSLLSSVKGAYYTKVFNNYIENFTHHAIDTHSDFNETQSKYNFIYNNSVNASTSTTENNGIYVDCSGSNQIFDNIIYNVRSSNVSKGQGINVEGGNWSYDNLIFNNTLFNTTGFALYDGGVNNSWYENNLTASSSREIIILSLSFKGRPINMAKFFNNYFYNMTFVVNNEQTNVSINESSLGSVIINTSTYISNSSVTFSFDGRKDLRVDNSTITINSLTPPYNDILNSSNRVILASNQNTYSITLNPNQQIEVGDFPVVLTVLNHSILHDKFNVSITLDDSMNATLHVSTSASFTTYMNFSDSAFSTSHELQATGLSPGTLYYYQVNGTNSVGGEFNTTIYSVTTATTYCGDNIFQATNDESVTEQCDASDLNSQTCLSVGFTKGTLTCDSSCQFITTDCRIKSQMCQNNLVPLSGMATWLGLLVTIICIAFVFILFTNNSINLKLEGDAFYATILIVISVGFLLGVGILILSNLC